MERGVADPLAGRRRARSPRLSDTLSALKQTDPRLATVVATAAVAVLLYISFWLIARMEHRRWMEFLRSRVFNAVSMGSTTALVLVGFTAMYREGLETALLYQALVDELHLMVSPNGVGSGTPILDSSVDLDLLEVRSFQGSANVLLRYAVKRDPAPAAPTPA